MRLQPGEVLGERFRLIRMIGEGGMGVVWSATDLQTQGQVALKFLKTQFASDEALRRFYREARTAMSVRHPNVVKVHEVFLAPDGAPVMSMDYLEGESLSDLLDRELKLSLAKLCDVLLPVLSAIGSAHAKGIVHRDLKPENIFLVRSRQVDVRVLDFGIAKLTALEGDAKATARLTSTGAMMGTPYYMSPEQVFAEKNIDHRCDVWSLGVILYECLSGKRPIDGESMGALLRTIMTGVPVSLRTLEPDLPDDVLDLVDSMLSVERDGRPASLQHVTDVLSAYSMTRTLPFGAVNSEPFEAASALPLEPTRWKDNPARTGAAFAGTSDPLSTSIPLHGRRRSGWWLAGGAALAVAVGGGLALQRANRAEYTSGAHSSASAPMIAPELVSVVAVAAPAPSVAAAVSASVASTVVAPSAKPSSGHRVKPTASANPVAPAPATSAAPKGISPENPYQKN